jgi:hypothetical protein
LVTYSGIAVHWVDRLLAELVPNGAPAAAVVAPQAAWLSLATAVAISQAAGNPDPLLLTPALTVPRA